MIAFMVALSHSERETFREFLEKYLDPMAPYIIGSETAKDAHQDTSGQHFHICCNMTDKQYDSFRKTILVKHYQLKGQARDGKARQYGRVRSIRDETRMMQYSVKDKNIIYKNIDLKTIQQLIDASYHRPEKRNYLDECMQHLDEHSGDFVEFQNNLLFQEQVVNYSKIEKCALAYYVRETEKTISRSLLRMATIHFMRTRNYKIDDIYLYLNF